MWRGVTMALVGAALLSGCLRFESSFDISDDGTVDVGILVAFDVKQLEEFAEMFGQSTEDLGDLSGSDLLDELGEGSNPCSDFTGSIADFGVTTEEFAEGDLVGVRCTVLDVPIDDIEDFGDDSLLAITQSDGSTTFDLTLLGVEELFGAQDEVIPLPGFSFEEIFEIRVSASAPGSVAESNATSTDGAVATWVISPDAEFVSGDEAVMTARWAPGGSSDNDWILPLLIALAAVAVLAAVGIALARRSRGGDDESTSPPPPPPSGSAPPVAPPPPPGSEAPPSAPPDGGSGNGLPPPPSP